MGKKSGLTRKDYNARYYAMNKERIKERRKRKYLLDREYRERHKKYSRNAYKRKVKERGFVDRTIKEIDGVRYYTTGYIAELVGRKPATVRTVQRYGVIPEVQTVTGNGWRLYTERQKDLIAEMFRAFDDGKIRKLRDYAQYLREHWGE